MKILGVFALTVLLSSQSFAGSIYSYCSRSEGGLSCSTTFARSRPDKTIQKAIEEDPAEVARREIKWENFCKPVVRQDKDGLSRYYYAQPGCEFGRSE